MSELSVLAQILTSAVGLMGALVAGLSVYFTYKGRLNQFRQVVYGRQMDAYFDITECMSHLFGAAQEALITVHPRFGDDDAGERFRASLRKEHEQFTRTVNRALIVLPSRVKTAVDGFNETLLAIGDPGEELPSVTEPILDPGASLAQAYERAVNC